MSASKIPGGRDESELHLLGKTIAGKYKLHSVQASGAFGTVFLAHQHFCEHFVRVVAVKISRQTGLTEQTAPGLFGDALILAQLLAGSQQDGKQHLTPIFDMGILESHKQRGFLVMEHVEGAPLLSHIRTAGRIGVASGVRYLTEICQALALVHQRGAVHRDLKPDNILIDRAGVIRVVDFGLATYTDPNLGFAPGAMGTFTYMAPETLHGQSTPSADVFGLGLVAYEMFTGGGPHLTAPWPESKDTDDGREHYRIKTSLRYPPPSESHNEIRHDHIWLDGVIQRCLESDPARRFRDAGELLAALKDRDAGAPPPSTMQAKTSDNMEDTLIANARALMATAKYKQVVDMLDVHRPAEWAVVDASGMRTLRMLGQAYMQSGDIDAAKDCLMQLQSLQHENQYLSRAEFLCVLSDLHHCCTRIEDNHAADEVMKSMRREAGLRFDA